MNIIPAHAYSQPSLSTEPAFHSNQLTVATQPTFSSARQQFGAPAIRAANANAGLSLRAQKSSALDRYMTLVEGCCPVEFAITGELVQKHPCPFQGDCNAPNIPPNGDWLQFKKSFKFARFAYCFRCGLPGDKFGKTEQPACHKGVNMSAGFHCPWDDFIYVAVHCLWHTPPRRQQIITTFLLHQEMDYEGFKVWARQEDMLAGNYHNALEVFIWYCEIRQQELRRNN